MAKLSVITSLVIFVITLYLGYAFFDVNSTNIALTHTLCQVAVTITMGGFIVRAIEKQNVKKDMDSENKDTRNV
ncbi:MAG: hypothetical protein HFH23_13000 [Ruminococcus sp.]|nr:hypothetical protein [Ruminococcus sp.]